MAITRFEGPIYSGPQPFSNGTDPVFGGVNTGKVVLSQVVRFVFNAANGGNNAYLVANLPDYSQIVNMNITITTAFTGSTATNVSLGVTGTSTKFINAVDLQSGGVRFVLAPTTAAQAAAWVDVLGGTDNLPLLLTVNQTGGVPTAGEAFLDISYVQWPQPDTTN